jgi:acetyl-CoA acetyltransferase
MIEPRKRAAIVGLGMTEMGKVYGRSVLSFAVEAVRMAIDDAGLSPSDVDGLLVNSGTMSGLDLSLQNQLGLRDLRLLNHMNAWGATAASMVMFASMAVQNGLANTVVCVFADAPLAQGGRATDNYSRPQPTAGIRSLWNTYGYIGANARYAMAARRHMELYGTTQDQLGCIAVSTRQWALKNPQAQMKGSLTLEQYHSSRWIAEPFHIYDCCLVSNGGIAVVVTSAERAVALRQPPVYILGWGQGHPGNTYQAGSDHGIRTGAATAGPTALRMAGLALRDVTMCELYDCYTYTVLVTLEDYGFCAKGDGGAFATEDRIGPGGTLPVNTGGGELSAFYMWGMTPISEAVIQARGQAGERQVDRNEVILVSGNGGILDTHATLIVGPHQ